MTKTNIGLVNHAEYALSQKWKYGWGSYGQIATNALVDDLVKRYPDMNTQWKNYILSAINEKSRLCDCYGLVKSYLWWTDNQSNPKYNSSQDRNTAGAYNAAKIKGALATLPDIPGIILYMTGHVGVYIGNGRFIECAGGGKGMVAGEIKNKVIVKGSKFTHWFEDTFITYEIPKSEEDNEVLTEMKLSINGGNTIKIPSILNDGLNYPNLREYNEVLRKYFGLDLSLGHNDLTKTVLLNGEVKS